MKCPVCGKERKLYHNQCECGYKFVAKYDSIVIKEIQKQMRFYCPCCGEESEIELELVLCPGSIEFVICPECGTMFKLTIQYTEVKNE